MSLVIALAASRQAVIAADRRAIVFLGSCPPLEAELYSGQIRDDRELEARAEALGAVIQVSDGREKVWRRGDLLVGEVTELSPRLQRRRRIYIAPGASLQVEIRSGEGAGSEPEAGGGDQRLVIGQTVDNGTRSFDARLPDTLQIGAYMVCAYLVSLDLPTRRFTDQAAVEIRPVEPTKDRPG